MLNTLLNFDSRLFLFINLHNNPVLDWIFPSITQLGNGWVLIPILCGIILIKTPRKALKKVFLWGIISMSVSGILNTQTKLHVGRERPAYYFENTQNTEGVAIHILGPKLKYNSFPSGHTNTVFAGATLLTFLYGGPFWLSYTAAFLVAYSRVYVGAHYPLDTVAGSIIGTLTVLSIMFAGRIRRNPAFGEKND